jgi:hypothetical protein
MSQKISSYFDYTIAGKTYKIRYRTPNVREQIAIGQSYAALKAGFEKLDATSDSLAYAVATLNIVIVDKPVDLKLDELGVDDWSVINEMLGDYQSFAFFRNKSQEPKVTA